MVLLFLALTGCPKRPVDFGKRGEPTSPADLLSRVRAAELGVVSVKGEAKVKAQTAAGQSGTAGRFAFKGGTDDIRESPALHLVESLLQEGSAITAYDPAAMERAREVLGSKIEFASSPYEAAHDADALLILTEWEEFANLDLNQIRKELRYPIVIDGRNLYDPELMAAQGFTYYSVGRAASHPDGVPSGLLRNGKKA